MRARQKKKKKKVKQKIGILRSNTERQEQKSKEKEEEKPLFDSHIEFSFRFRFKDCLFHYVALQHTLSLRFTSRFTYNYIHLFFTSLPSRFNLSLRFGLFHSISLLFFNYGHTLLVTHGLSFSFCTKVYPFQIFPLQC